MGLSPTKLLSPSVNMTNIVIVVTLAVMVSRELREWYRILTLKKDSSKPPSSLLF